MNPLLEKLENSPDMKELLQPHLQPHLQRTSEMLQRREPASNSFSGAKSPSELDDEHSVEEVVVDFIKNGLSGILHQQNTPSVIFSSMSHHPSW